MARLCSVFRRLALQGAGASRPKLKAKETRCPGCPLHSGKHARLHGHSLCATDHSETSISKSFLLVWIAWGREGVNYKPHGVPLA